MNDLIERQAAIEAIESIDWYHQNKNKDMVSGANSTEHQAWYKADDIYNTLDALPTVEAEPVRHGHWAENNGRYGWYCSQCKKENNYAYHYNENNAIELQDHYCPHCGAKMDGERREDETIY